MQREENSKWIKKEISTKAENAEIAAIYGFVFNWLLTAISDSFQARQCSATSNQFSIVIIADFVLPDDLYFECSEGFEGEFIKLYSFSLMLCVVFAKG